MTCYYAYDDAQRVTSMDYRQDGSYQYALFEYDRDAAGNITKLGREGNLAVYYSYDAAYLIRACSMTLKRAGMYSNCSLVSSPNFILSWPQPGQASCSGSWFAACGI